MALAELSARLAPVDNAPIEVIRRLARDDEIIVAAPVLSQSARLTTHDLVDIAQTKSQAHLLAISGRAPSWSRSVTDQLLSRGDREVKHKLAKNAGARFSETGFTTLVKSAETDESLAKKVGLRLDLPLRLLRELLLRTAKPCDRSSSPIRRLSPRMKFCVSFPPFSNEVSQEATARRDFSRALQLVVAMQTRN